MAQQLPRLILTGASGFVGRRLLELLAPLHRIEAVDLRAQGESGAPRHPNIRWHQLDLGDGEATAAFARRLAGDGPVRAVVHLAAYYDFTGDYHPEYARTNVGGLRNVLEASAQLGVRRFLFASSLAACAFPPPGGRLDETARPDGEHPYAVSKRRGETLLREFADRVPSTIVRFAALFSDWCEYPPLFVFLDTWLSRRWNRRILGGRGQSAVPYLHVRDAAFFVRRVLERMDDLEPCEVLLATPDGATTHQQLFDSATAYPDGRPLGAIHVPRPLAIAGLHLRDAAGRLLGHRPFERPWMGRYVDLQLAADARHTRRRLDWQPRARLEVLHRIPFLLENRSSDPVEWMRRNRAMERRELHPNLRIHSLLDAHQEEIADAFTRALTGARNHRLPHYDRIDERDHLWHHRLILHNLMTAVRTREKAVFMTYCRDLAEHRFDQGFDLDELRFALRMLDRICLQHLSADPAAAELTLAEIQGAVTRTIQYGLDRIEEVYETREPSRQAPPPPAEVEEAEPAPR
jgi:nucleoside-diphosphate-sugar epimerase